MIQCTCLVLCHAGQRRQQPPEQRPKAPIAFLITIIGDDRKHLHTSDATVDIGRLPSYPRKQTSTCIKPHPSDSSKGKQQRFKVHWPRNWISAKCTQTLRAFCTNIVTNDIRFRHMSHHLRYVLTSCILQEPIGVKERETRGFNVLQRRCWIFSPTSLNSVSLHKIMATATRREAC